MNKIVGDDESLILQCEYDSQCETEFQTFRAGGKVWFQINHNSNLYRVDDLVAMRDFLTRKIDALSQPKDA
jgi:hypothetical protein